MIDLTVFLGPCRSMVPIVLDSDILGLQTLEHVMRVSRTWDSIVSLIPKGGETIWGNLDWSPEEEHDCDFTKKRHVQPSLLEGNDTNNSDGKMGYQIKEPVRYGRIISFGKATSQLPTSQLPNFGSKVYHFIFFYPLFLVQNVMSHIDKTPERC